MKISDIYSNARFALSFEVFPPKTPEGLALLYRAVEELSTFQPGFISCTYGAGGSTQDQTLQIVTEIRDRFQVTTTAHLTCTNTTITQLREWLQDATTRKIENIMALRGDPPRGEQSFIKVDGGLAHANELVTLLRNEFPHFGIGVAGYPEKHHEAETLETDIDSLKRKVDSGANAIFTQLFYDNTDFFRFHEKCLASGITVPIIPGLLPILSLAQIQRITNMCGATLPQNLATNLDNAHEDPAAQSAIGIEHATRQCVDLLKNGVSGIHFYVLNKSEATIKILNNVRTLLPSHSNNHPPSS